MTPQYDFKLVGEALRAVAVTAIVAALQVFVAQDPERVLNPATWGLAALSAAALAAGHALIALLTKVGGSS